MQELTTYLEKVTIDSILTTGTHRVNFHVVFRGNFICDREDARFTYKRLNSKINAICKKVRKQTSDIVKVVIKKV